MGNLSWEQELIGICRKNGVGISATDDLFGFARKLAAEIEKAERDRIRKKVEMYFKSFRVGMNAAFYNKERDRCKDYILTLLDKNES